MLGETVHVYIDTDLGYRHSATAQLVAVAGGRLSDPQLSQWRCRDIAPHGACRAKTDTVFGECLKHYLTDDTQLTKLIALSRAFGKPQKPTNQTIPSEHIMRCAKEKLLI